MKKIYIFLFTILAICSSHSLKAQLEYKDVAPIFYNNCTSCHHVGSHVLPMMTYSQVQPLTWAIQNALQIGKMPPWSPDTTYNRFAHERVITQSEKTAILDWITAGAPAGDTTLAPAPPVYSQYKLYGDPTLTLQMPTYSSTATSADIYVCFAIPSGLTEDRILRAFEIIPGNPQIVHHVIVTADTTGTVTSDLSGSCFNPLGDFEIGGYAPGAAPTVFPGEAPLKAGIRIKAGSQIILQMHYPAGSVGQIDSTKIRMFFYPPNEANVRPIYATTPLQNWLMYIPSNTVQTFSDYYPGNGGLPQSISLFATFPHSHKICTSIVNYAFSGADTIPLVRINKWDFNWQGFYTYKNLIHLPAGYRLYSEHVFDNTLNNPNNPNSPPTNVTAGTGTNDEMLFDGYMWLEYQTGDELVNIEEMLANDPLLDPATLSIGNTQMLNGLDMYVYPNPSNSIMNIEMSKKSDYNASIVSITGQTVVNISAFTEKAIVNVKNIPNGVYMLEIADLNTNTKINKKIVINNN